VSRCSDKYKYIITPIKRKKNEKKNSYNTATPFVADREPRELTTSYAGGTSPLTLSCPDTNLSYNELDLIIASLRRGCLNDAIVGDARFIELVSAADAPESDERLEMTASVVVVVGLRPEVEVVE
jgi:hypothetical protein